MALVASGRLFERESNSGSGCEWTSLQKRVEQRLWLRVDGSSEESQTAALVASGRLFGRESNSGSEVVGSSEERTTATWVRGVVDSSEKGQTAVPFNKSDGSRYLETVKYVEY